jgi:hypothetical protein
MKIIMVILLSFNLALGCDKNVDYKNKGDTFTTKCDGYYVKKELMSELKNTDEALKISEKQIIKLKDLQVREVEIKEYYKSRSEDLQKELTKKENRSNLKAIGAFALGVIITSISAYATIRAVR